MLKNPNIFYSIIIPAYKSREILPIVCQQIAEVFSTSNTLFELIIVDDASPDDTWSVIHSIRPTIKNFRGIRLQQNAGQHNAIYCGLQHASGDYIITLDDDLQFSPYDIPLLIERQKNTLADIVYGIPIYRKHSLWRNIASKVALYAFRFFLGTTLQGSSFRLFKKDMIMPSPTIPHIVFIDGIINRNTKHTDWVNVSHKERLAGVSGHKLAIQGIWAALLIYTYSSFKMRRVIWAILTLLLVVIYYSLSCLFLVTSIYFQVIAIVLNILCMLLLLLTTFVITKYWVTKIKSKDKAVYNIRETI